jgi:hypothetical protein
MSRLCEARVAIVIWGQDAAAFLIAATTSLAGDASFPDPSTPAREAMEIDDFLQAAAVLTQWLATAARATVT